MGAKSRANLKAIRFGDELLPNCAQWLDLAARLCPVSEEARHWFSLLTARAGVDDARTVIEHCDRLRQSLQAHRESVAAELRRGREDGQASQIMSAWFYALDTIILEAGTRKTCSWTVEDGDDQVAADSDGGDITLRRL